MHRNCSVGDLALVIDNNLPRNRWILGRVVETYRGKDDLVKSAKVKTRDAVLIRPVVLSCAKLCLLETVEKLQGKVDVFVTCYYAVSS